MGYIFIHECIDVHIDRCIYMIIYMYVSIITYIFMYIYTYTHTYIVEARTSSDLSHNAACKAGTKVGK
jgi:hypothetical protein